MKLTVDNKQFIKKGLLVTGLNMVLFLLLTFYFEKNLKYTICNSWTMSVTGTFTLLTWLCGMYFAKTFKNKDLMFCGFITIVIGAALTARFLMLDFESFDYRDCLSKWMDIFGESPGVSGWSQTVGDYNMPYLYILTFISKLNLCDLYLTKTVSVCFDVVLAYFIMKLASLKIKSEDGKATVFVAALFIPTVMLNGAYWSQCDSIYASLALAFLYYGIKNRPNLSMIALGLAFSFKLQTVFIMPMLIVFLFVKKIKLRHLVWFPAVFFATLVPALIAGKPFMDAISVYYKQVAHYPYLQINATNVYQLFPYGDFDSLSTAGIVAAGVAVLILLYILYQKRQLLDDKLLVLAAFAFVLTIPMLLPKMHERYFFLADALAILVYVFNKRRWFVPLGIIYGSLRSYTVFLSKNAFESQYDVSVEEFDSIMVELSNVDFRFLAVIFIAINILIVRDIILELKNREKGCNICEKK